MHPRLHTRLCDLVGVEVPIVQTGMGWVAGPRLVSATANAGALGILASATMDLAQLRQAARLMRILFSEFGIPDDRVTVVVNRFMKRSTVALEDIQRTLAREKLVVLPNAYKSVVSSIDGGLPLLDFEPSSPVAKAIVDLQRDLCGTPRAEKTGLLRRALPIFSGDDK